MKSVWHVAHSSERRTWTDSVGRAADKIEQQAQKVKGKWAERKRRIDEALGQFELSGGLAVSVGDE